MLKKLGMKAVLVLMVIGTFRRRERSDSDYRKSERHCSRSQWRCCAQGRRRNQRREHRSLAYRPRKRRWVLHVYKFARRALHRQHVSTGFQETVATGVEVHVGENKVLNLDLQVGQVSETVTVTSDAAPVETRSGDVSSLISEKQVTELPLNGRNYSQLALMVPGVSPVTQAGAVVPLRPGTGLDGGVDMSVNGNGSNQNLWTVDGVNNMDVGSNRTLLVFPSIDSIAGISRHAQQLQRGVWPGAGSGGQPDHQRRQQ